MVTAVFLLVVLWHLIFCDISDAPLLSWNISSMNKSVSPNINSTVSIPLASSILTTVSEPTVNTNCAPREGVIIVNVLGRLANDLFQVAFANRLSQQVCWPILYRPFWGAELPSQRGYECFSHASLPQNHALLPESISTTLQDSIQLNASIWNKWASQEDVAALNKEYHSWVHEHNHSIVQLEHLKFDFTKSGVDDLVESTRSPTSQIQVVSMEAFFIHYDWMKDWMPRIREWLQMNPSCCQHTAPPDDAVVMHVRAFDPTESSYNGLTPSAYIDILRHYDLLKRPLWIVCQPKSAGSHFVQEVIKATAAKRATVVTGIDQYDAFCTLTRAKTLVLSYVSSYSQMAALLNIHRDEVEVHYPLTTLDGPEVTLAVPGWHYHLVNQTLDGIQEWDVGYERIRTKMA